MDHYLYIADGSPSPIILEKGLELRQRLLRMTKAAFPGSIVLEFPLIQSADILRYADQKFSTESLSTKAKQKTYPLSSDIRDLVLKNFVHDLSHGKTIVSISRVIRPCRPNTRNYQFPEFQMLSVSQFISSSYSTPTGACSEFCKSISDAFAEFGGTIRARMNTDQAQDHCFRLDLYWTAKGKTFEFGNVSMMDIAKRLKGEMGKDSSHMYKGKYLLTYDNGLEHLIHALFQTDCLQ